VISDLADIVQKCVKSSFVTTWLNHCSLCKSVWMNKLKRRQEDITPSQEINEETTPPAKKTKKLAPSKDAFFLQ